MQSTINSTQKIVGIWPSWPAQSATICYRTVCRNERKYLESADISSCHEGQGPVVRWPQINVYWYRRFNGTSLFLLFLLLLIHVICMVQISVCSKRTITIVTGVVVYAVRSFQPFIKYRQWHV